MSTFSDIFSSSYDSSFPSFKSSQASQEEVFFQNDLEKLNAVTRSFFSTQKSEASSQKISHLEDRDESESKPNCTSEAKKLETQTTSYIAGKKVYVDPLHLDPSSDQDTQIWTENPEDTAQRSFDRSIERDFDLLQEPSCIESLSYWHSLESLMHQTGAPQLLNSMLDKYVCSNSKYSYLEELLVQEYPSLDQTSFLERMKQEFPSALKTIKKFLFHPGDMLSSIDFSEMIYSLIELKNPKPDEFKVLLAGINPLPIQNRNPLAILDNFAERVARKKQKLPNRIFIPFVFNGKWLGSPNHIVLVTIDFLTKKIIYFDSQGRLCDHFSRLMCFDEDLEFDMRKNLSKMAEKYLDCFTQEQKEDALIENSIACQEDIHNCGIYVFQQIESTLNGFTQQAFSPESRRHVDIREYRYHVGKRLLHYHISSKG